MAAMGSGPGSSRLRPATLDVEDSRGGQTTPVRGCGSDHGELNRPVAMPDLDRRGDGNPRPFPTSKAEQRGEDLAGVPPHDCAIENKRWAVPAEARAEHDAVVGVGQRGERHAHDTAGLTGVDRADRRWRTPVGEHPVTSNRDGGMCRRGSRISGSTAAGSTPVSSAASRIAVAAALRRRPHARRPERRPRRRDHGAWPPSAPAGRPARGHGRSRSGSGPRPAGRRPCQVRDRCGLVLPGEPQQPHGQARRAAPARSLAGGLSAPAIERRHQSATGPHAEV